MRWRLSVLMFLQCAAPGAMVPFLSLWLKELQFDPISLAWVCSAQSLALLVAPFAAGQLADRVLAAERCLLACSTAAGFLLWILAGLESPVPIFLMSVAIWLAIIPSLTIGTTLIFVHLQDPVRGFGPIRLWGTVGWMFSGMLLGYWFTNPNWAGPLVSFFRPGEPQSRLADVLRLGSLFSFGLGLYSLTLPHTPPPHRGGGSILAPLAAMQLFRSKSFAVYAVCYLGVCVTLPFTVQVLPMLLEHLGVSRAWMGPTLTIAQTTEILSLYFMPMMLTSLGLRKTMLTGLCAWVIGLSAYAIGSPSWLVVAAMTMNGICICCFMVSGQILVNSKARGDARVSAQALLGFLNGVGQLTGNLLVGLVRQTVHEDFRATFLVGAVIAMIIAVVFQFGFQE